MTKNHVEFKKINIHFIKIITEDLVDKSCQKYAMTTGQK